MTFISLSDIIFLLPVCWNWQTRRTQNPLSARTCGFDPHHRHHVGAKFALLRLFCLLQKICHPLACSSFPQKVTLGSPAQLQAPSQRFAVATNFLRVQIHHSKMEGHLFCYLFTRRDGLRDHNPVRISGRDFLSLRHRSFSAKNHVALSLFACKRAHCASACSQLYAGSR